MEIDERITEGVAVLSVRGSLMVGSEVRAFHERVKELVEREIVNVIVDFSGVEYCGSVMLGQLTASKGSLKEKDGDIRLAHVSPKFNALLTLTGLRNVFDQFASTEGAVASFSLNSQKLQPPFDKLRTGSGTKPAPA